jgi:hypothetical protein
MTNRSALEHTGPIVWSEFRGWVVLIVLCGGIASCRTVATNPGLPETQLYPTPLGHLGSGCRFRGGAESDVWLTTRMKNETQTSGPGALVVRLLDLRTSLPLPSGSVTLTSSTGPARSLVDSVGSGWFDFGRISAGTYNLRARRIGYESISGPVLIRPGISDTLMIAVNATGRLFQDIGC